MQTLNDKKGSVSGKKWATEAGLALYQEKHDAN